MRTKLEAFFFFKRVDGGGVNNNGNFVEAFITLDPFKRLHTVQLRHVEVKDNKAG